MLIQILKETSNEIRMELEGASHTFCNVLQNVLLEDAEIEVAGYDIPHPLTSNPIIYVRTKENYSPRKALENAIQKLRERSIEFVTVFEQALKSFEQDNS